MIGGLQSGSDHTTPAAAEHRTCAGEKMTQIPIRIIEIQNHRIIKVGEDF